MANVTSDSSDVIRDSVANALSHFMRAAEPRINEFATASADRVLEFGRQFLNTTAQRVRARPWYLVAAAAILLVGAAVVLGVSGSRSELSRRERQLH